MISVIFMIVFFLVALMIVGLVLLQEGKGGGLTGMSTGMDGVMGAKNPLRKITAWLFVFFVLMCLGINWYFHESSGTALPQGLELSAPETPVATTPEAAVEAVAGAMPPETATPEAAATTPAPEEPAAPEGSATPEEPAAPAE